MQSIDHENHNFQRRIFVCKENSRRRSFYWWKQLFLNPPIKHQNDRVWSAGKKRCRQKSPGSRKGEICQPRHALCWCVLWRIRKTVFHSREGKRKWQTLPWKSVTQTGWRLQVSFVMWFHIPAGRSARSHGKAGAVGTLYTVRFGEVSGLSSFKIFWNPAANCGENAHCLLKYFILSHPVHCIVFLCRFCHGVVIKCVVQVLYRSRCQLNQSMIVLSLMWTPHCQPCLNVPHTATVVCEHRSHIHTRLHLLQIFTY